MSCETEFWEIKSNLCILQRRKLRPTEGKGLPGGHRDSVKTRTLAQHSLFKAVPTGCPPHGRRRLIATLGISKFGIQKQGSSASGLLHLLFPLPGSLPPPSIFQDWLPHLLQNPPCLKFSSSVILDLTTLFEMATPHPTPGLPVPLPLSAFLHCTYH